MACSKCNWTGFKVLQNTVHGQLMTSINQCLHCKDVKRYTRAVQMHFGGYKPPEPDAPVAEVIPFTKVRAEGKSRHG